MYMENVKEHYWRYSLITIILGLGVILFFKITPFLGGILGAFTIYILLRGQMFHLTEKLNRDRLLQLYCYWGKQSYVS